MNRATLHAMLNKTAVGRAIAAKIKAHNKLFGDGPELLGRFDLMHKLHDIGKITSKFTGPLAKKIAGMVGIPPEAIDALAKADPTTSKALHAAMLESKAGRDVIEKMPHEHSGIKPIYLIAGAAILGFFLLQKK